MSRILQKLLASRSKVVVVNHGTSEVALCCPGTTANVIVPPCSRKRPGIVVLSDVWTPDLIKRSNLATMLSNTLTLQYTDAPAKSGKQGKLRGALSSLRSARKAPAVEAKPAKPAPKRRKSSKPAKPEPTEETA